MREQIDFHADYSALIKKCKEEIYSMFDEKGVSKVEIPYEDDNINLVLPFYNYCEGTDNKVVCGISVEKVSNLNGKVFTHILIHTEDGYVHNLMETTSESIFFIYYELYNTLYNAE